MSRIDEVRWDRTSETLTIVDYEEFNGHRTIEIPMDRDAQDLFLNAVLRRWRERDEELLAKVRAQGADPTVML